MVRKPLRSSQRTPFLLSSIVRDGARFKYKLTGVMVYFLTCKKINTNQYYESDSLNAGSCNMLREYMTLQDDRHIKIPVHT
jgi:hypothetical protein